MCLPARFSPCHGISGNFGPLRSVERSRHSYSSQPSARSPRISKQNAEPGTGIGVMRRERDGAAQCRNAFFEAAAVMQRGAEIGPAVGIVRIELDGAAIGDDRFVEAAQGVQRIAEIAVRFGEIGLGRDRLALRARGAFVILQFVERDAEIAQRRRHCWARSRARARAASAASLGRPARRSISPRLA